MNQSTSLPIRPKTDGRHTVRVGDIYSRARDKARTMQYAIRSGRPKTEGQKEKKQKRYGEGGDHDTEMSGGAGEKSDAKVIKKPRLSALLDTDQGGEGSRHYELPMATVQLDVIWIPENKKGYGLDWVKTITFRNLLQQLEKQKVKLLLDQDDESALVVDGGDSDSDCNRD